MIEITKRRVEICEFIVQFTAQHGYAPTVREIGHGVGIVSTGAVQYQILTLQRAGALRRQPGVSRALVVKPGFLSKRRRRARHVQSPNPRSMRHAK
ncbi:MAG: hypothetical protein HY327_02840 [Chloroflexi bacterium]|nr:hypothetical protein [Chloroflexota bacterium]